MAHVNLVSPQLGSVFVTLFQSESPNQNPSSLHSISADIRLLEIGGRLIVHKYNGSGYSLLNIRVEGLYGVVTRLIARRVHRIERRTSRNKTASMKGLNAVGIPCKPIHTLRYRCLYYYTSCSLTEDCDLRLRLNHFGSPAVNPLPWCSCCSSGSGMVSSLNGLVSRSFRRDKGTLC